MKAKKPKRNREAESAKKPSYAAKLRAELDTYKHRYDEATSRIHSLQLEVKDLRDTLSRSAGSENSLRIKLAETRNNLEALKGAPADFSQTQIFQEVGQAVSILQLVMSRLGTKGNRT